MSSAPVMREIVRWQQMGFSVKGASHVGSGLPMQDAIQGWPDGTEPAPISTLVVSDGHGDKKHFRSAVGSKIAAHIATQQLTKWTTQLYSKSISDAALTAVASKIAKEIYGEWSRGVTQHAQCEPFPPRYLSRLSENEQKLMQSFPLVAYGATCLAATLTASWGMLLRIGDGVIACCHENGSVSLPFDEQEKSSQLTASLCSRDAERLIEMRIINFDGANPVDCLVLSTDGYPDAAGGVEVCTDRVRYFAEIIRTEGVPSFEDFFVNHLNDAAPHLFDDTTIGFLVRELN